MTRCRVEQRRQQRPLCSHASSDLHERLPATCWLCSASATCPGPFCQLSASCHFSTLLLFPSPLFRVLCGARSGPIRSVIVEPVATQRFSRFLRSWTALPLGMSSAQTSQHSAITSARTADAGAATAQQEGLAFEETSTHSAPECSVNCRRCARALTLMSARPPSHLLMLCHVLF